MHSDTFYITDALEDLLDIERAAILDGTLKDMGLIAREKEMLLGNHDLTAPDRKTLDRLRRKADRNQQLLAAAIRGVRTVTARLNTLRNGPGEMNTYDRTGQRSTLGGSPKGALQHRA